MSQPQTRANIKKLSFVERSRWAALGGVIGAITGFIISALSAHLGTVIWIGTGLYCLGVLAGVDDWVSYLSGFCPSCSKPLKLGHNQKQGECPHCNAKLSVEQQDKQHWIRLNHP